MFADGIIWTGEGMRVLDACCGSRMFWFDKHNPDVVFQDIRECDETLCNGQRLVVKPDVIGDFRKMNFPDESFNLVVFDPPHLMIKETSWLCKKYGSLDKGNWRSDLSLGFSECFRVLKPDGVLIFKWAESHVSLKDVLSCNDKKPLFGHKTKRGGFTFWVAFIK